MAADIHPSAIIHSDAQVGDDVQIGPNVLIERDVTIGDRCRISQGAVIKRWTQLGDDNYVKEYAVLGGDPQHLSYRGQETHLKIGRGNMIGEFATLNRASEDGGATVVGDENYIMAYAHIGHDCRVGNKCILTNFAGMAGFSTLDDHALMGGYAALHQFVRVGCMAMIGGGAKIGKDALPYMIYQGMPAEPKSVNLVGMRRHGVPEESRKQIRRAYKILFREGLSVTDAVARIRTDLEMVPEIEQIVTFIENSPRGIAM